MFPRAHKRNHAQTHRYVYRRPGISLVELMVASVIMVLVAGTVALLANAVQSGNRFSQTTSDMSQHGRICLERIERTMNRAFANESFPGIVSFAETEAAFSFPETVVVWDPPSGTPTDAAGLPLVGELTVFCTSITEPNKLLEITLPGDSTVAPPLADSAGWTALLTTLKNSNVATRKQLTTRLRTSVSPLRTRGNVRFETRLRPTDGELAAYRNLASGEQTYANWRLLTWPQGLYSQSTGVRQAWCRIELQFVPETESSSESSAVPFFGSVALYYSVTR